MLRKVTIAAVMALTAGAVGITGIDTGQAFPIAAPQAAPAATTSDGLQLAAYKRKKVVVRKGGHAYRRGGYAYRRGGHVARRWTYSARFGHRYHYRRAGYGYYYGGWWYPRPWWSVGVGVYPSPYYGGCRKVVKYYPHKKVVRRVCY